MKRYIDLYFTTSTILDWRPLLIEDAYKDIVIDTFRFLVAEKRVTIWAFVIMDDHIHLVWQISEPFQLDKVQHSLLTYTANKFRKRLKSEHPHLLDSFYVNKKDRQYQFWQRGSYNFEIYYEKTLQQKIRYIHLNPLRKWGLMDYKYSSIHYYDTGEKDWDFLL